MQFLMPPHLCLLTECLLVNFLWTSLLVMIVTPPFSATTTLLPTSLPHTTGAEVTNASLDASTSTPATTTTLQATCYPGVGCFNNSAPFNNGVLLPQGPEMVGVKFRLYTRRNIEFEEGQILTLNASDSSVRDSHFNSSVRTRVIIHGFLNHINETWIHRIKRALLKIEDSNVLVVGWGRGANVDYEQAVANTRLVAKELRLLLDRLVSEAGLRLQDVHLIGHSLGAHTSGDTGRQMGGRIGRITGMDPAGPDFQNFHSDKFVILDKSDAQFVDNIHTNGKPLLEGGAGMSFPTAHQDFYVNGGKTQPGCTDGISGLLSGGFGGVACSHGRSHDVFVESIKGECAFTAYPCPSYEAFQRGECLDCEPGGCSELGLYADQHKTRGSLYLNTLDKAPFCGFHYSITIHSGQGKWTTGTVSVALHGTWGSTPVMQVTEHDQDLAPGQHYVGMVVSPVEVGQVRSLTVRYVKNTGLFSWLRGSQQHYAMDAVHVLSGESGRSVLFCVPERHVTHSSDVILSDASSGDCT